MMVQGAFHPNSYTERLYLTRQKRGNRLIMYEGCIENDDNNLGWYVKKSVESLIDRH